MLIAAVALFAQSAAAIALESAHQHQSQARLVLKKADGTAAGVDNFYVSHIAAPGATDREEMQVSFATALGQAVRAAPGDAAAFLRETVSGGERPAGPVNLQLHFDPATNTVTATAAASADDKTAAPAGSKFWRVQSGMTP